MYSNSVSNWMPYLPFQVISYLFVLFYVYVSFLRFNHYVFVIVIFLICIVLAKFLLIKIRFLKVYAHRLKGGQAKNEIIIEVCENKTNMSWDFCLTNKMNLLLLYYALLIPSIKRLSKR